MNQVAVDPRLQDSTVPALGTTLRVAVLAEDRAPGSELVEQIRQFMHAADLTLSRFQPQSELRLLEQRGGEHARPASRLLTTALSHAVDAAHQTGGLLDPTLGHQLEAAGYVGDWDPARRLPLAAALAEAPPRRSAAAHPAQAWRGIWIDRAARRLRIPAGVRVDLGATAKGLLADLALRLVGPAELALIDLGGDLAIGGSMLHREPVLVLADDPFGGDPRRLHLHAPGGIATSSIAGRCWRSDAGPAHHILDPATGLPAFTGVVQATAAAKSAAAAEILAGHALLAGPAGAAELLRPLGGVLVLDDGTTHTFDGTLLTTEHTQL